MLLKAKAIRLRKQGRSLREIEDRLKISRSTLSGWFRDVVLTEKQKLRLKESWLIGLIKAREKAALFHKNLRRERLKAAFKNAVLSMKALNLMDKNVLKLALAMLFIGEGFKAAEETSIGNSDPRFVKTFVKLLDDVYGLDKSKLRIYLHLRADQKIKDEIHFWSRELEIDPVYFKIAPIDKRTIGKPTYFGYHGVCVVRYYDVSIKRELMALSDKFFNKITRSEL